MKGESMLFEIKYVPWIHVDEYVISINGKLIGRRLTEKEARCVKAWLDSAMQPIAEMLQNSEEK